MGRTNKTNVSTTNVDLLRVVANELKLPLTNIQATSSLLSEDKYSNEEVSEQHQRLVISSEQAIEMIDAILLAGRVQTKQTSLNLSPVSAAAMAREVAADLKNLALRYDRSIYIQVTDELSPVSANSNAVKSCLRAMLDNIIRSSRSEVIEILVHQRLDTVIMTFRDHGESIGSQTVSKILKNLGKSTQPAKSLPSSSGLSVYVSTILMEAMGGKMDAYSIDDRRSITFTLKKSQQLTLL